MLPTIIFPDIWLNFLIISIRWSFFFLRLADKCHKWDVYFDSAENPVICRIQNVWSLLSLFNSSA